MKFFREGDELQLAFNFYLSQHVYLALARSDPDPARKALQVLPSNPPTCQYANFLMNHDELTLAKLTLGEREVGSASSPSPTVTRPSLSERRP